EGIEKRGLFARLVITAIHLMVANGRKHWDQPPIAANHVLAVVANKRQKGLGRAAIFISKVTADYRERRILPCSLYVVVYGMLIYPGVTARNKGNRIVGLCRHGPKAIRNRTVPNTEIVVCSRSQTCQLCSYNLEIRLGKRLLDDRRRFPSAEPV